MQTTVLTLLICIGFNLQNVTSYRPSVANRVLSLARSSLRSSIGQDDNLLIAEIKTALLSRPDAEPLLFNLGMLLGRKVESTPQEKSAERSALIVEALDAFIKAVKINGNRDASWCNIANLKQQAGDKHGAIMAYRQTIKITENPDVLSACYSNLVQLLLEKGDLEEAAIASNQAVNACPDDSTAWTNMGIVLRENLSFEWAVICFENAVKFSDGTNAVALNNLGNIYSQNNEVDKAYEAYSQALQVDPMDEASAYSLAMILTDSGDQEASKAMFQKCIDINPSNSAATFQLAALLGNSDVEQCPTEYVADLFDHYAKTGYDSHMVNNLQYRVPDYIWDAYLSTATSSATAAPLVIVELGAGTGLVGSRFRRGLSELQTEVEEFVACDLSQEMIVRAYELMYNFSSDAGSTYIDSQTSLPEVFLEEENVYTDVVISECTEYLQNRVEQGAASADLILAGDVLVYIGNLEPLFRSVKASLLGPPEGSGRFIFSVEKLLDDDSKASSGFALRESARFAHTKKYVMETAEKAGLTVLSITEVPLRYDGGNAVNGYIFVLQ